MSGGGALFGELEAAFGKAALEPALFYQYSPALRLKLADGDTYIAHFLQALDRARAILALAFAEAERVTAVLEVWSDDNPAHLDQPDKLWQKTEAALRGLGRTPHAPEHHIQPCGGKDWPCNFFAFTLPASQTMELLWGILADDLGITPRLSARLIIAAPELGVLACPYDSRGLDIVGPNTERLAQLYREFDAWLLDYDRARMDAMFGGEGGLE